MARCRGSLGRIMMACDSSSLAIRRSERSFFSLFDMVAGCKDQVVDDISLE